MKKCDGVNKEDAMTDLLHGLVHEATLTKAQL